MKVVNVIAQVHCDILPTVWRYFSGHSQSRRLTGEAVHFHLHRFSQVGAAVARWHRSRRIVTLRPHQGLARDEQ